jgi:hypothetical protein
MCLCINRCVDDSGLCSLRQQIVKFDIKLSSLLHRTAKVCYQTSPDTQQNNLSLTLTYFILTPVCKDCRQSLNYLRMVSLAVLKACSERL